MVRKNKKLSKFSCECNINRCTFEIDMKNLRYQRLLSDSMGYGEFVYCAESGAKIPLSVMKKIVI
jgi:hypothetical protein